MATQPLASLTPAQWIFFPMHPIWLIFKSSKQHHFPAWNSTQESHPVVCFCILDLLASSIPLFMANFPDLITESDNPACQHLTIQTPSGWKPIHKPNCCKFQFYAQVYTCYFFVSSTTVTDCNCFASIHSNAEAKLCSEEAVEGTPKGLMQSLQGVVQSLCSSMWAMLREALEISTVPEQVQTKHLPTYVPSLTYSLPPLPPSFLENWKLDVLDKINLVLNGYTEKK